jgi:predicted metal-dependent peptidase
MYTIEQRIERAKVSMIRDSRFAYLAGIFMLGKTEITYEIPTACTNGRDVMFNPAFVELLDEAELRGLIYHEYGGHIMMRHLSVYRPLYEVDPKRANKACDYVVNQAIVDYRDPFFIALPAGGLQNDKYRGMDSRQVFELLKQEPDDKGDGDGGGETMDHHDWEGAAQLNEQEERVLSKEIDSAVRQSVLASKLIGHKVDRAIEDWLTPKVDWREALRDFMVTSCSGDEYTTYRKPRRRMLTHDVYMGSPMSEKMQSVVLAVDTSMSIGQAEIDRFLSEVVGVCDAVKPDRVHLIYWGSQVVGHERYEQSEIEDIRASTKPVSGGGTNVNCVTQYMLENSIEPTCAVVLTDGELYGGWGQWSCPVLWAVTGDAVADVGQTVCIKEG